METESSMHSLEFVIDKSQSAVVEAAEKRITYLFNVKIELKGVFAGSPKPQQWISVTGTVNGANRAKDYILALTSPAEKIYIKDVWNHPLFTSQIESEIERSSCAALFVCEDGGLVIRGTEFSVMMAQSMIEDIFGSVDSTDKLPNGENSGGNASDSGRDKLYIDNVFSAKDRDELRGNASLNKNNSSLASVVPQPLPVSTVAAHYADGLTSDPRSSCHQITTPSLFTPFSPSGSDVYLACTSTPLRVALTENCERWNSTADRKNFPLSAQRTSVEQQPAIRNPFPHEIVRNSMYASASAIYPQTSDAQILASTGPHFYSNGGAAQTKNVFHTVNHTGDGEISSVCSYFPTNLTHNGQIGEQPMEIGNADPLSRMGSTHMSPQAKDQQIYLRNLGHSLHYSNEDIEKGLALYSMDEIIVPSEFLETLKKTKAQRHGGGHDNIGTDHREIPSPSHAPSNSVQNTSTSSGKSIKDYGKMDALCSRSSNGDVSGASNTAARTTKDTAISKIPVHDYSDLDESVILIESVMGDTIIVSSDDELDQQEEPILEVPVPRDLPQHKHNYLVPMSSEVQPKVRREPPVGADRNMAINRNLREVSATSQNPTGRRDLRYIVIDGSNVSMAHGNNKVFSVEGLRICIYYFVKRGHDRITAFVPEWRRYSENQTSITGRALLEKLHNDGFIKFTPARRINGKTIASYDDRFILNLAEKEDAIVVSNDQFRDLCQERASYQNIVANSLLQFMFVGDHFMPPDDPLGRHGPHLDDFLRYSQQPLMPSYNNGKEAPPLCLEEWVMVNKRQPNPKQRTRKTVDHKKSQPVRSQTATVELFKELSQMFPRPDQASQIHKVLNNHKSETDLNRLSNYCINALTTQ